MRHRLFFAALALSTAAAFAGSPPSPADQAKVEAALKDQGYTSWKSIVLDKGIWKVDDAINAAGKQFDLKIDAATLKIISKEKE
jgi:uncharacterized membrane protein YkoI